jgi:hypothetical protein
MTPWKMSHNMEEDEEVVVSFGAKITGKPF